MSSSIAAISSQTIELFSRRVEAKVRRIDFKDCQQFWFLITNQSAVFYQELSRKIIFIFPEELNHTDLLQKQDGSLILYGIQSDHKVVTFDVTARITNDTSKRKHEKSSEDEVENMSSKRFKKEEKEKERSDNEAIFDSLLTFDLKDVTDNNATTDNVGMEGSGKLFQDEIVYIQEGKVLHEDARLVDCLLLGNILVAMATCLEGYIISFHTTPNSKTDIDNQRITASSMYMFASFFIKELRVDLPLNSKDKNYNSLDFTRTGMTHRKAEICGFKLTSSHGHDEVSSPFGLNSINQMIFSHIFGSDCTSLGSEVIMIGTPEGKILSVPLKCESTNTTVSVLFDLEEPAVLVSRVSLTNHNSENNDMNIQDCLIFVGKRGKVVVMYAVKEQIHKGSKLKTLIEEKLVSGPVISPMIENSNCLVYSTKKELFCIRMEFMNSQSSTSKGKSLKFTARRYPVMGVICVRKLPVLSASEDDAQKFVACLMNGRVVYLNIKDGQQTEETVTLTTRQAGQRMKELMINLQEVTRKTEEIRQTSKMQNSILSEITKAGHLAAILSRGKDKQISNPFLIEMRTFLQHDGSTKQWMIECKITNKSDWKFDDSWKICAYMLSCKSQTDPFKDRVLQNLSSCSKSGKSIVHPLKNWNPDTYMVLLFPIEDGESFLAHPIEIKLYLHLRPFSSTHFLSQQRFENTLSSAGDEPSSKDTGLIFPIGYERVDILSFLEPADSTQHDGMNIAQSSSRYGAGQNQSISVAMETMHKCSSDWLSETLKGMMSTRMPTAQDGDVDQEKTKVALRCPMIVVTKETMTLLHQQDHNFLHWLFNGNSLVISLLQANPSLTSLQLQSPSCIPVQIMISKDDSLNSEVKVQIHTSSHHLQVKVMEAIHFKLAKFLPDKRDCSLGTEEDKDRLMTSIQNVEKKISQLRDRELHKISQHDLEDVYDALRNLNLKF